MVSAFSTSALAAPPSDKEALVYFGTYTGAKSKGIYVSRFNSRNGELSPPELAAESKNPSFLAIHPNRNFLYAVGEISDFGGQRTGAVSAFRIDRHSGKLELINQQSSGGAGPCHLALDAKGRCVLVANYGSGSVAALPIAPSGELKPPASTVQHSGSSVNKSRQSGPHAHHAAIDSSNRRAFFCDLGLDRVMIYRLDPDKGLLTANEPPWVAVDPGSGPRHLVFGRGEKNAYVVNEMASSISAFQFQRRKGAFTHLQAISILPPGAAVEQTSAAEIQIHPSGKFVYASNRGHDVLAVFSVGRDGTLRLVGHESTLGKTPRHFVIDPTGKWLLAENQNSDSIVVFEVNSETGALKATGHTIEVGSPVCAVFLSTK